MLVNVPSGFTSRLVAARQSSPPSNGDVIISVPDGRALGDLRALSKTTRPVSVDKAAAVNVTLVSPAAATFARATALYRQPPAGTIPPVYASKSYSPGGTRIEKVPSGLMAAPPTATRRPKSTFPRTANAVTPPPPTRCPPASSTTPDTEVGVSSRRLTLAFGTDCPGPTWIASA